MESVTKVCAKCKVAKAIEDFHKDRGTADGLKNRCRLCTNEKKREWRARTKDAMQEKRRREYHRNRETYLAYYASEIRRKVVLKHKMEKIYGITIDIFEKMVESQEGRCAICRRLPSEIPGHRNKQRLGVDHDHETGQVRGLLCQPCNFLLGGAKDSVKTLRSAIKYLQQPPFQGVKSASA